MKIKSLKSSAVILLALGITGLQAQESVNTSGGTASGSGGSSSYTVGQLIYSKQSSTSGSASAGVQQIFEITVVNSMQESKNITLAVTAYPNPTTGYLTLEVKDFELSTLLFQLYDMSGKLLQSKKLTGAETQIDLNNVDPATYFLKIIQTKGNAPQQEIKTFKIIKH